MYQLDFAAKVDRGLVRETNQDVARIAPELALVVVADGMGGHEFGDVASGVAVETTFALFESLGGVSSHPNETANRLVTAFEAANTTIRAQSSASRAARMGTTLVAAAFGHEQAVIAHVGDSRCYLIREGALECLTHDHSYGAELRRQGLDVTAEQRAVVDQFQNVLTRCIGEDDDIIVDARVLRVLPNDTLLLCSDGLWGGVEPETITRIIDAAANADEACNSLIKAAWQSGGLDNIGVAVVRVLPPDDVATNVGVFSLSSIS
jgi:protein phosphatase